MVWPPHNWRGVPERIRGGIVRYIENGIPPGDFLEAVIKNDLREACLRADDENQFLLFDYVYVLYNYAPVGSWGSPQNYKEWIKHRGLAGGTKYENPI